MPRSIGLSAAFGLGHAGAESWRPIRGFPNYEVSDLGRIHRLMPGRGLARPGHLLKTRIDQGRWVSVLLFSPDRPLPLQRYVGRLVAEAFWGAPQPGAVVEYLTGDPLDCRACNVRWARRKRALRWRRSYEP